MKKWDRKGVAYAFSDFAVRVPPLPRAFGRGATRLGSASERPAIAALPLAG